MKHSTIFTVTALVTLLLFVFSAFAFSQITPIDERTVKVTATGYADKGTRNKKMTDARTMAQQKAVELVVNDILRDQTELSAFEEVRGDFNRETDNFVLSYDIVRKWEEGKRFNLELSVTINKDAISQQLVALGVMSSTKEAHKELNRFIIMPYLDLEQSSAGADEYKELFYTRFRVFFEDKGISTVGQDEVMAAEGDEEMLARMQSSTDGGEEDPALMLARNTPADIFVKIVAKIEQGNYKGTPTHKVILTVGAYTVLTGEFIGSGDGFSEPLALSSPFASVGAGIDQAMNNAMPKVIDRIGSFWRDYTKDGRPVKIIFTDFGFSQKRKIREALQNLTNEQRVLKDAGNVLEYMVRYSGDPTDLMYEIYDGVGMETIGLARDPQIISNTIRFQKQP